MRLWAVFPPALFLKGLGTKKSKSFPAPMAHRAAPISVSVALGHTSANAVRATVGGWSTGSSACLTSPLLSHLSSARREGSEYHFKRLWYDSAGAQTLRPSNCEADALTTGPSHRCWGHAVHFKTGL